MRLRRFALAAAAALASFSLAAPASAQCPSPRIEQFGYNARPMSGVRPLLIVLVDFTDADLNPARGVEYYRRLVFGDGGTRTPNSVNGMYDAASGGRFRFSSAGVINVTWPTTGPGLVDRPDYDAAVTSQSTGEMRRAGLRPFESYDRNGDRVVDHTELAVLRVSNSPAFRGLGQTRGHTGSLIGGFRFSGDTSNVDEEMDINGIAHELFHGLGYNDHIYGPGLALNYRASFFAASFYPVEGIGPIALDPYSRMLAGWLRPRLVDINTQGTATIRHYGSGTSESDTLLFYDSAARCTSEFFLAEYRNPSAPGAGVDTGAFGPGLFTWYVRPAAGFTPFQFNWPPPIRGPFRDTGAGDHAIANYVVGPGGPGQQTAITAGTEFAPMWGDGAATGVAIEAGFAPNGERADVSWRRGARFVARVDAINGAARPEFSSTRLPGFLNITGTFPAVRDGLQIRLINLSRSINLDVTRYTNTSIEARLPPGPVPAGTYYLQVERASPRGATTRPNFIVTFR